MLDTVVSPLDRRQFEVLQPECFSPSAKGLLAPPYYPLGLRGNFACVQNPTKADLQDGRYLPRLTLAKRKKQSTHTIEIDRPQRPDCVADDAVSCELVSAPNSLLTGKLTGNFAESGPLLRFRRPINEPIQRLAAKFPTQRNREFLQP